MTSRSKGADNPMWLLPTLLCLALASLGGQDPGLPPQAAQPEPAEDPAQQAIHAVQSARLEVRGKPGRSGKNVKECVTWFEHLYPRSSPKRYKSLAWSSKPATQGRWVVTLKLFAEGEKTEARWEYDPRTGGISCIDHLSKFLSWVP